MARFLQMARNDTVATCLETARAGDTACIYNQNNKLLCEISLPENITHGNKVALCDITPGEDVIKYGACIGECYRPIRKGQLVHLHNVKSRRVNVPPLIQAEILRQMGVERKES